MRKLKLSSYIFLYLLIAPLAAAAGDFDGSKPLLVSVIKAIECTPDEICQQVSPESIELPQFLKIDFKAQTIAAAREGATAATRIERTERVDGKLILQGAEDGYQKLRDGLGWTMTISEDTGRVVLTASGEQVAFVVFGACIPM